MKFGIGEFREVLSSYIHFYLGRTIWVTTLNEDLTSVPASETRWMLLERKNISNKRCRKENIAYFMFSIFSPKS
jgi:hypothetical protein